MPIGYCSFTHQPIEDSSDGIWDDGEWISWDYISQLPQPGDVEGHESAKRFQLEQILEEIIAAAIAYRDLTGRYLDIFGELGELYAEFELGLKRHKANAPGSDGRLGNDFVEVKTISPMKQGDTVRVKRQGNFNKLYVVRISETFEIEGRLIARSDLRKSSGKHVSVRFKDIPSMDPDSD